MQRVSESNPAGRQDPGTFSTPTALPTVSVVVVHWNNPHLLGCLQSVVDNGTRGLEVIVVDNASTDGEPARAAAACGRLVRTIRHPHNVGYTRGANAGLRQARGRYVLLLNNDAEIAAGCVERLVAAAETDARIGICCPKILVAQDRRLIESVGHWIYPDGVSRCRGRFEIDRGQYDRAEDVLVPSGCALLVRRAMLDDIGLLDEDFFAYCDDTDLGLRAQLRGWRCVTVPSAVVYHWGGSGSSPLKAFLNERNRLWVAIKCLPLPFLLLAPFFTLLRFAFLAAGVVLRRGPAGRFAAGDTTAWVPEGALNGMQDTAWLSHTGSPLALLGVLRHAVTSGLRGLPRMWRKRRAIQRSRCVPLRQMAGWWRRYGLGPRAAAWAE
jgi:GT2 family glycosyltransferase